MSDYVPITCVDHDRLELAVLKRRKLYLRLRDGDGWTELDVLPLDVYTQAGAEWLRVITMAAGKLPCVWTRSWNFGKSELHTLEIFMAVPIRGGL